MIKNTKVKSFLLAFVFTMSDVFAIYFLLVMVELGIIFYSDYKNIHINIEIMNICKTYISIVCAVVLFIKKLKKYLARTEAEWELKSY